MALFKKREQPEPAPAPCPYCGTLMEHGYIASSKPLCWSKDKPRWFTNLNINDALDYRFFAYSCLEANRCQGCQKIVIDTAILNTY